MQNSIIDNEQTKLFFSLIRCGMGKETELPYTPSTEEWQELFDTAIKQTLSGIAFAGIERLPKEQRPGVELLLKWHHTGERTRKMNRELTKKAILVSEKFKAEGFGNCILKGQGIAQYYPDPELRTPGDIDIWLNGSDKEIIGYVKRIIPCCEPKYHHVDFPIAKETDIEIHYRPTWMYNPVNNKRLQRFFDERRQHEMNNTVETSEGPLHVPTTMFNTVYIPIHIYRHLFSDGIGMRQVLDYYYVLQHQLKDEEKAACIKVLERTGLKRFTGALMYAMQQMFGLEEEKMIAKPDKKHGEFLLREILLAGNFGKYDERYETTRGGINMPHLKKLFKHSSLLIKYHPSETLWNPLFKIWHYWWRKRATKS